MCSLDEIREVLRSRPASLEEPGRRSRAAVAMVVCDADGDAEILFIERSQHEADPWSGHLGFPGGRVDPGDGGPRAAAERETWEEVGLDLAGAEYLGRIDDLNAVNFPVVISCFVYGLRQRPVLTLEEREVADAFWFPLAELLAPDRRREVAFQVRGEDHSHPAIQVLDRGRPHLWGITYRLVSQFLEVMGRPLSS